MEPEELLKESGETVRRLSAARGYSQEEFAQAAGQPCLRGTARAGPAQRRRGQLYRIAEALGVSLSELFAEVEAGGEG